MAAFDDYDDYAGIDDPSEENIPEQLWNWLLDVCGGALAAIAVLLIAPAITAWLWGFMQYVVPH